MTFFPPFIICVALCSGPRRIERWPGFLTVVFVLMLLANLMSPFSLQFETLEASVPLYLPWGETLNQFTGKAGAGNIAVHLLRFGMMAWLMVRAAIRDRKEVHCSGLFLAACIVIIAATGILGWLIDIGMIDSVYLSGFDFLGFVMFQSASSAHDFCNRTRTLEAVGVQLHDKIERRRKAELIIADLRSGVSSFTGTDFFEQLVKSLAMRFKADYVFVGLLEGAGQHSVTTLLFWVQNGLRENLTHSLANTPCADVAGHCTRIYANGVRKLFPDDEFAQDWGMESYVGTPLFDSEGKPLGIVVVASTQPLQDTEMDTHRADLPEGRLR